MRVWQMQADEMCRQWLTSPPVLSANGFLLDRTMDFYESFLQTSTAFGFDGEKLKKTLRGLSDFAPTATKNIVAGLKNLQKIGVLPPVAQTACEVVFSDCDVRLLRYKSDCPKKFATPVLLISSLIGKHYIFDLTPKRSYVAFLLEQGFDVFLLDWGTTDENCAGLDLEDYVGGFLPRAVKAVCKISGSEKVTLFGYSLGGLLATIYSALNGETVKNLLLLTTPLDFRHSEIIKAWTDEKYLDIDRFVDLLGSIPADVVLQSFQMVKPASSFLRGVNLWQYAENAEDFAALLALEIWLYDAVPFPGRLFRTIVKKFYRENLLAKNKLEIGGRAVDLSKISCPILNVAGDQDQIAPPASSAFIENAEHLVLPYGHLTILIGSGACEDFWEKSAAWLGRKDEG